MPFAPVNGVDLYYESHGDGPPVAFAHGVGGNHASWFNQVVFFSKTHRVITFDHRGFGNSVDVADSPGRGAFVDDLQGLLDHLDIEMVALVAQSMGGGACAGFTARHPERVAALVLADTLQGIETSPSVQDRMVQVNASADGLSQAERVLGTTTRAQNPVLTELYLQLASFNRTNRRTLAGALAPLVTPGALAATGVPILFVVGEEDVLFPPDVVRAVHEETPGSEFHLVPSSGHSAYCETPELFNTRVLEFLSANGWTEPASRSVRTTA